MKKLTGISLIVLGALLFSFSVFIIIDNTITIEKGFLELMGNRTLNQRYHESRNTAYILSLISLAIAFGGFKMKSKRTIAEA